MAKSKKKPKVHAPEAVVLRMASRLNRLPEAMRAGYIARAKTPRAKTPTRNDAGLLAAVGEA